uniref:Transposase n=1 Tax=Chenopodium quinoa TaxID=63459 RepID=A0A803MAQ7_CHEQI
MYNTVYKDEKWFELTKKSRRAYLAEGEKGVNRSAQSQKYIPDIMFEGAVAKPWYNAQKEVIFDRKIGIFPFGTRTQQREILNTKRKQVDIITKVIEVVIKYLSRKMLIDNIMPAIMGKWQEIGQHNTIFIQQDNARAHVTQNDPEWQQHCEQPGFTFILVQKPPNIPDLNVLDLDPIHAPVWVVIDAWERVIYHDKPDSDDEEEGQDQKQHIGNTQYTSTQHPHVMTNDHEASTSNAHVGDQQWATEPEFEALATIAKAHFLNEICELKPNSSMTNDIQEDATYGIQNFYHSESSNSNNWNMQPIIINVWNHLAGSACDKLTVWDEKFMVVGFTAVKPSTLKGFSLSTGMDTQVIYEPKGDRANVLREWSNLYAQMLLDRQSRILQIRYLDNSQATMTVQYLKEKKVRNASQDERHWVAATIYTICNSGTAQGSNECTHEEANIKLTKQASDVQETYTTCMTRSEDLPFPDWSMNKRHRTSLKNRQSHIGDQVIIEGCSSVSPIAHCSEPDDTYPKAFVQNTQTRGSSVELPEANISKAKKIQLRISNTSSASVPNPKV